MIRLSPEEKRTLEVRHRSERDRRVADRIKAVLLNSEGWSNCQISQALRLHEDTIRDHINDYLALKKLKPENGGSQSKLSQIQTTKLIEHLEQNTYIDALDICAYIKERFGIEYSRQGITDWLHAHNFSYKKPKGTPAKADMERQKAFIKEYQNLLNTVPEDEPIEFLDAVHPSMATKVTSGWIRTGKDKLIATTASRTRVNIIGSINLENMGVTVGSYETVNSQSMIQHFGKIREKYPNASNIHIILDRGSYNISTVTREAAIKYGIVLHHLPPYSPNLNPIERLWKVMNEYARNNRFFKSAKEFRQAIDHFFSITWPSISKSMIDRINDNFQTIDPVSSV